MNSRSCLPLCFFILMLHFQQLRANSLRYNIDNLEVSYITLGSYRTLDRQQQLRGHGSLAENRHRREGF